MLREGIPFCLDGGREVVEKLGGRMSEEVGTSDQRETRPYHNRARSLWLQLQICEDDEGWGPWEPRRHAGEACVRNTDSLSAAHL